MPRGGRNIVMGARPFVFWLRRIYRVPDHAARPPAWGQLCAKRCRALDARAICAPTRGSNRHDVCGQPPHKLLTILSMGCSRLWLNGCAWWG